MIFDRACHLAAAAFTKPLFQHRGVSVVSADPASRQLLATQLSADGAGSVSAIDATALSTLPPQSVEVFFCALGDGDLRDDAWAALLAARAANGVVVVLTLGDASTWSQALSRRFASVERAELVRGDAAWVGPPGAVSASVALEGGALGSVFVCAERPQRLVLGSVAMGGAHQPPARAARAAPIEQSLSQDIAASLDEDRLHEVEARLAKTMEDLVQAQLVAAQALAERDALKRRLEQQRGGGPLAAPSQDATLMEALHKELLAIEALVKRLPRS
jgi:hypothetical protein